MINKNTFLSVHQCAAEIYTLNLNQLANIAAIVQNPNKFII